MEPLSREGGRHYFILGSDKNKKDHKKSSKQSSRWLPQTKQRRNKQNGSKSTNHKLWPFEPVQVNICFLRGPLDDWRNKHKIPSNNKNDLWWAANPDVVKTFFNMIYTNIMIIYFLYPLENWLATYFELALSTKLCAISLSWFRKHLWLANFKICLIFHVWLASVRVVAL